MKNVNFELLLSSIPGPTIGAVKWSSIAQVGVLQLSAIAGGFLFATASLDQWYRTIGTLSLKQAKHVLIFSVSFYCLSGTALVLLGSAAHSLGIRHDESANRVAMQLLTDLINSTSGSLKFALLLLLTCIVLTTIDTYLITLQQLYYEGAIKIHRQIEPAHWLRYLFKQQQVRSMTGAILVLSIFGAFMLSETMIYRCGLAILSGSGFVAPLIVLHALSPSSLVKSQSALLAGFLLSLIIFPFFLWLLISVQGSFDEHVIVICGAAVLAQLLGYGIAGIIKNTFLSRRR